MRITVASDKLYEYMSLVSRVISTKVSVSVLECVLFEVKGNELKLTASDGEMRIVTSMDLEGDSGAEGAFCVKAKPFLESIREVLSQNLVIDIDESTYKLNVNYATGNFELLAQSGENYPQANPLGEDHSFSLEMPVSNFSDGLEYTIYATSNEDTRPLMMGVYVDARPESMTFVGTDGFMLAMFRNHGITHEESIGKYSFTLQKKAALLLRTMLQKENQKSDIKVTVYHNFAVIESPKLRLQCRLLEGKYPNYESVIPPDNDKHMVADRLQLLTAVRRVSIFGNHAMDIISLDITGSQLVARASDQEFSTRAEESLPVSFNSEEELKISFKANNLINVLNTMPGDNVVMKFGDKSRAVIITPQDAEENIEITAAVMPMLY